MNFWIKGLDIHGNLHYLNIEKVEHIEPNIFPYDEECSRFITNNASILLINNSITKVDYLEILSNITNGNKTNG